MGSNTNCYAAADRRGKTQVGDVVHLKGNLQNHLTVVEKPVYNWMADHDNGRGPLVTVVWIDGAAAGRASFPAAALAF